MVWHANLAENFNVSIPYLQIRVIRVRDSKFGHALVLETTGRSGGYILGFRIDPMERLTSVFKEITAMHAVYTVNPMLGIKYHVEEKQGSIEERKIERKQDDVEIVEQVNHTFCQVKGNSASIHSIPSTTRIGASTLSVRNGKLICLDC